MHNIICRKPRRAMIIAATFSLFLSAAAHAQSASSGLDTGSGLGTGPQRVVANPKATLDTHFILTQSKAYDSPALASAVDRLQQALLRQPGFHASMTLTGLDGFRLVGYVQFDSVAAYNAAQSNADVQSAIAGIKRVATRYDDFDAFIVGGQSGAGLPPPSGNPGSGGTPPARSGALSTDVKSYYRPGGGLAINEAIVLNGHSQADLTALMERHRGSAPNDLHGFSSIMLHSAKDGSRNFNIFQYDDLRDTAVGALNFGVQPIINAGLTTTNDWNPRGVGQINVWVYEVTSVYSR